MRLLDPPSTVRLYHTDGGSRDTVIQCNEFVHPLICANGDNLSHGELLAAMSSFIRVLLSPGCPAAIGRFVVTVIVAAVERHPFRRIAHIGLEILKHQPTLADQYTAPAVIEVVGVGRIAAPIQHRGPTAVQTCSAVASCCAVLNVWLSLTTTIPTYPRSQISARHFALHAAHASAQPMSMRFLALPNSQHHPRSELTAN